MISRTRNSGFVRTRDALPAVVRRANLASAGSTRYKRLLEKDAGLIGTSVCSFARFVTTLRTHRRRDPTGVFVTQGNLAFCLETSVPAVTAKILSRAR